MENQLTPKQKKRQQEREIINEYHKNITEAELEPLFQSFLEWKSGSLPYDELTELIHLFHKKNQEIYKDFNYSEPHHLLLLAKMKTGRLTEEDIRNNIRLLEIMGYKEQ